MSATPAQTVEQLSSALDAVRKELADLRSEFEAYLDAQEDAEAIAMFDRIRSLPREEAFPAALVERLLDDEPPIVVYREHRGMTQAELAKAVGTTASYISQIETGHRDAGKALRKRLAEALRVGEEDLL